jgi:pyrimidine deaminase RibD-like protein
MSTELSIGLSVDSKENAFCHYCPQVGHFKNYAVCNHLIEKRKSGRLTSAYEDCSVSISKKTCPALKMRKEEIDAGHAIHFVSRTTLHANSEIRDSNIVQRAVEVVSKRFKASKPEPVVVAVAKKEEAFVAMDYAAVISLAAKEVAKPIAKVVVPPATLKPEEGESMIDFAKRMMSARKAAV